VKAAARDQRCELAMLFRIAGLGRRGGIDLVRGLGEARLQIRHPARRFGQPLARERAGARASGDGVDRVVLAAERVADEYGIAAGADRQLGGVERLRARKRFYKQLGEEHAAGFAEP